MILLPVEITRDYPRGGVTYPPGVVISVPPHAVPNIVNSNPPFGRLVDELPDVDATESAWNLADEADPKLDLAPFAGQGTLDGGRIQKSDVQRWIAERDAAASGGEAEEVGAE